MHNVTAGTLLKRWGPMSKFFIHEGMIQDENRKMRQALNEDYDALAKKLKRRQINIEDITRRAEKFTVAIPSWGTGTGGTRFGVFKGQGEPRDIHEKLEDCAAVNALSACTPAVSLHIPWDKTEKPADIASFAKRLGLSFDAMNSNTFQDQPGQKLSYKYGSLSHSDPTVRAQAVAHNIECIHIGKKLGSKALTVWLADGTNFPGQQSFRKSLDRYLESLRKIYEEIPSDWRLYIEHKYYEPAFYSTVLHDWGVSYYCTTALGKKAFSLVDLGHHAPNANIEQIVARLIQFGKLGGFHFNDSKYGDDDLDAGAIKPFQLFLVFNELVDAELEKVPGFEPAYMIDQSHNITDPLESLLNSAMEIQRAFVQALLVDRRALAGYQANNDAMMALNTLKVAFTTDVSPILAMARSGKGGAIDPIAVYRKSGYRKEKGKERK
jgi:L-rhamnose isomerase / sugar isomerase